MIGREKGIPPLLTDEELEDWEWIYCFESGFDIEGWSDWDRCDNCGEYVPKSGVCPC